MPISVYEIKEDGHICAIEEPCSDEWVIGSTPRWIDVQAEETDPFLDQLKLLNIPSNVIHAVEEPDRSLRFVAYPDCVYMEFPVIEDGRRSYFSIILIPGTICTFHRTTLSHLNLMAKELAGSSVLDQTSAGALMMVGTTLEAPFSS